MLLKETLDQEISDCGMKKHRMELKGIDGVLIDDTIVTDSSLTAYRDNCVTCHELEHKKLAHKNLLFTPPDLRDKTEAKVERNTVMRLVPIDAVAFLYMSGARSTDEFSDALEVDEEFFINAIKMYNGIYGVKCSRNGWVMTFSPFGVKTSEKRSLCTLK